MKYIRTKDGIYEISKDENDDFIVKNKGSNTWCLYSIFKEKYDRIIPADTIEELCDEYVIVFDKSEQYDNELFNAKKYTPVEVNTFYKNVKIEKVYGAIWTDKGLIYVAKMNEKGYLELL
jgi:peptide subunit release factor RF-3